MVFLWHWNAFHPFSSGILILATVALSGAQSTQLFYSLGKLCYTDITEDVIDVGANTTTTGFSQKFMSQSGISQ